MSVRIGSNGKDDQNRDRVRGKVKEKSKSQKSEVVVTVASDPLNLPDRYLEYNSRLGFYSGRMFAGSTARRRSTNFIIRSKSRTNADQVNGV